ncbi:transcriptional repressor LexA [Roseococcus sp.]|uniref:transcriptional repressor LexA n=1 Tax=Roseococcus sp. TaxID=2109646 RepID=UPI003BAD055C
MLTRKQHELLMFINQHLEETGFSPSFDEMKAALDLKSKSGIHRLITALEERGFLRRRAHRARALEVVRLPGSAIPPRVDAAEEIAANVVQGNFGRPPKQEKASSVTLPLFGRIAAGIPIEALRDQGQGVDVPVSMLGTGEHYALEVAGDSMIEAGILDGDTVVICRGDSAENGDIVVALVDENEVTLKRLRRRGNSVALEPANRNHEIRIFGPDRVQVQGRLIGLLRSY